MIQIPSHKPAPSDNLPESVEELLDDVSFDVEEYETEAPPAPRKTGILSPHREAPPPEPDAAVTVS